jgi:hypothetical protein
VVLLGRPGVEGTLKTFKPERRKEPAAVVVVTFAAKHIEPVA